jgi:hypothetical protein
MELTAKNIILSAVGFLLVAILTPIAMDQLVAANTTSWETAVATVFSTVLPIVYIIGIAYSFIKDAM